MRKNPYKAARTASEYDVLVRLAYVQNVPIVTSIAAIKSRFFKRKTRQIKTPMALTIGVAIKKAWQCPTFAWRNTTLSSALSVFTSEFGKGSGGSRSLWPPGRPFTLLQNSLQQSMFGQCLYVAKTRVCALALTSTQRFGCYMVKPHGQLVRVSSMPYGTYTSRLSTWWSTTAL